MRPISHGAAIAGMPSDIAPVDTGQWWIGLGDAAAALGVSRDTLRTMVRLGQLPTMRLGRRTVIRRCDLERFKAAEQ